VPANDWIARTRDAAHVDPALLAAITAAGGENGRYVVLALKKYALVKPAVRRTGRPADSGSAADDDDNIILCCGPRGLWPTELIAQMRDKMSGISLCRSRVCTNKVFGHTQTWAEGLSMCVYK
jgi:hypothetical protein